MQGDGGGAPPSGPYLVCCGGFTLGRSCSSFPSLSLLCINNSVMKEPKQLPDLFSASLLWTLRWRKHKLCRHSPQSGSYQTEVFLHHIHFCLFVVWKHIHFLRFGATQQHPGMGGEGRRGETGLRAAGGDTARRGTVMESSINRLH